jgi:uncharacterized protein with PhoU and TrkA domain
MPAARKASVRRGDVLLAAGTVKGIAILPAISGG